MPASDFLNEAERRRSDFIRELVQRPTTAPDVHWQSVSSPPQKLIHFWDNLDRLPRDVGECIASWKKAEGQGFETLLFDNDRARHFIGEKLGARHANAYKKCYHPAMQSDYFRLCYIFVEGGCFIDADDEFHETPIHYFCSDGRLKLQPLCYDLTTNSMVPPSVFTKSGADSPGWIFYLNMNPLIAGRGHPLIRRTLARATCNLERDAADGLPEIQATAGPGNLTQSIFDAALDGESVSQAIHVLHEWERLSTSKWPLSYRDDARNWRLSNGRAYRAADADNEGRVAGAE